MVSGFRPEHDEGTEAQALLEQLDGEIAAALDTAAQAVVAGRDGRDAQMLARVREQAGRLFDLVAAL